MPSMVSKGVVGSWQTGQRAWLLIGLFYAPIGFTKHSSRFFDVLAVLGVELVSLNVADFDTV